MRHDADAIEEGSDLWPCQRDALDAVLSSPSPRLQVIMPCGTGKTRVGHAIAERSGAERVLVCAPSITLVAQLARSWEEMSAASRPVLLVCSDSEAAEGLDVAAAPTTDAEEVRAFLAAHPNGAVFSTYHSAPLVAEAADGFDLLIADEAHRIAGDDGSLGTVLLDEEALPVARRVSMTATPRLVSGGVSMDDEALFGAVAYEMSFREAVKRGRIVDYRLVICAVDPREVESSAYLDSKGRVTEAGRMAALLRALHDLDLGAGLVFHNRIIDSETFAAEAPVIAESLGVAGLQAVHLDGSTPAPEREEALRWLAEGEGARCITNARLLQEGVDVPSLDWVAFLSPRSSVVDIAQAVGRAVRLSPGKEVGTIIVPIIADPDDLEGDVMRSEFGRVVTVVKALMEHDEALRETMEAARRDCVSGKTQTAPADVLEVVGLGDLGPALLGALAAQVLAETTDGWWARFHLVREFIHQHNKLPSGTQGLARWLTYQRGHIHEGMLAADKVAALRSLPHWRDRIRGRFGSWVDDLEQFARINGHIQSPDPAVRTGIRNMLNTYRKGKISARRQQRLEAIPGWTWERSAEHKDRLIREVIAEGGMATFTREPVFREGRNLSTTVRTLCRDYRAGTIKAEKAAELESIPGWQWLDDRDLA